MNKNELLIGATAETKGVKPEMDMSKNIRIESLRAMVNEFELLSAEALKFRRALMVIRDNKKIDPVKVAIEAIGERKNNA